MANTKQKILTAAISMTLCVTCGAPDGDVQVPIAEKRQAYKGDQTTALEGGSQESLGSVVVFATGAVGPDGLPLDRVFVEWAELKATQTLPSRGCVPSQTILLSGKQLVGSILLAANNSATQTHRLRIDAVTEHLTPRPGGPGRVAPGQFEYQLTLLSLDSTAEMGKLCGKREVIGPGSNPAPVGLPFTGFWNSDGSHNTGDDNRFSFGCLGGALVECLDFGYKPWEKDMRPLHQACTRMARADYCGDGTTFTLTGTPINVYDFEAGETHSPQVNARTTEPGFLFEAAWKTGGADYGTYCLSKSRWDTLPLGACPNLGPDPRLFVPGSGQVYCENFFFSSLAEYRKNGAFLFNDSLRNDAGLVRWQKPGLPTEFFTSAKYVVRTPVGFSSGLPALASDESIRLLDYACPIVIGPCPPPRMEGAIFRPDVPLEITSGPVIALRNFYSPSRKDYYLTTDPAPTFSHVNDMRPIDWELVTEYLPSGIEGYIYERPLVRPPKGVQLNSWWHPTRGEHLTTTDPSWSSRFCKLAGGGLPVQTDCQPGFRHYPPTPDDPNGEYQYVREEGFLPR